ncbi:hypothetical protein BB559_004346 [Furculomyces boomerangus]|uniref:Uncharacterized protein n=2 Tax=Harpellales TaxID=61421 RepID=A0A2T9YF82_9FUNG|nr:hypothetical protein BB559_004346 [Furculomyces boomerangus]PWA01289.1 hypothetical protein BB558_002622 [Smittium angustum]
MILKCIDTFINKKLKKHRKQLWIISTVTLVGIVLYLVIDSGDVFSTSKKSLDDDEDTNQNETSNESRENNEKSTDHNLNSKKTIPIVDVDYSKLENITILDIKYISGFPRIKIIPGAYEILKRLQNKYEVVLIVQVSQPEDCNLVKKALYDQRICTEFIEDPQTLENENMENIPLIESIDSSRAQSHSVQSNESGNKDYGSFYKIGHMESGNNSNTSNTSNIVSDIDSNVIEWIDGSSDDSIRAQFYSSEQSNISISSSYLDGMVSEDSNGSLPSFFEKLPYAERVYLDNEDLEARPALLNSAVSIIFCSSSEGKVHLIRHMTGYNPPRPSVSEFGIDTKRKLYNWGPFVALIDSDIELTRNISQNIPCLVVQDPLFSNNEDSNNDQSTSNGNINIVKSLEDIFSYI